MSAIPQYPSRALSTSILDPLRQVRRRQWVAVSGKGLLQTLAVSLLVWLVAVVIAGFVPQMPLVIHVLLSVVAWSTLVVSACWCMRPALRHRSLSRVARQVEFSQGDQNELLSSAVELSTDIDPRFAGSPELVAHLVKQAEHVAKSVRPNEVVSYRPLARWAIVAAPVLLAWLVIIPLWPVPMLRGLRHVIAPWREMLPAALIEITVKPGDVTLVEGDVLEATASVSSRTVAGASPPASLQLRYPSGQVTSTEMLRTGEHSFALTTEQLATTLDYRVSTIAGSSRWFHATIQPRPAVAGIIVSYTYPKYTRLAPKTEIRTDGAIDAVVGTQIRITIRSTQPLDPTSQLLVTHDQPDPQAGAIADGVEPAPSTENQPIALTRATGNDYVAEMPLTRSGHYRVDLIGETGLSAIPTPPHKVTVRTDQPPAISIVSPAVKISLLPDDTVPVVFKASDDFGVANVQAIIQLDDQSPQVFNVPLGARGVRELSGSWKLSIPFLLARNNLTDANRVVYQLRATDAHQPASATIPTRTAATQTRNLVCNFITRPLAWHTSAAEMAPPEAQPPLTRARSVNRHIGAKPCRIYRLGKEDVVRTELNSWCAASARCAPKLSEHVRCWESTQVAER